MMNIEKMTLVIAIISLVVMIVTLFVTIRMLVYMKKSDRIKSEKTEKLRKKEIMTRIHAKEKQRARLEAMSLVSGSNVFSQIEQLNNEISELEAMM